MGEYKRLERLYLSKPIYTADKPSDCHYCCFRTNSRKGGIPVTFIFEKRYHNSAGARMGSDHASYGRIADFFQVSLPNVTAVFDIFQQ